MKSTEEIYGMSQEQLDTELGKAMIKAQYDKRIEIIKNQLTKELEEHGSAGRLVDILVSARDFWKAMRERETR